MISHSLYLPYIYVVKILVIQVIPTSHRCAELVQCLVVVEALHVRDDLDLISRVWVKVIKCCEVV